MTRLSRKNNPISIINTGNSIADILDVGFMQMWRISEAQYDCITDHATDQDRDVLCSPLRTFAAKKIGLLVIEKLLLAEK